MPLCSSFCPYQGPEPAGRAMLSDWLGRARSPIAQMGPGTPKSVDRRARARVGPAIAVARARRREGRDAGYAWASRDILGRVGCYRARGLAGSG